MAGCGPGRGGAGRDRVGTLRPMHLASQIDAAIQVLMGIGLIVLVLMHSGKDAGLSGAFGVGTSQFGGTQVMERNLTRLTVVCSVLLFCTTVALGFSL